jgi:hypothetical protein
MNFSTTPPYRSMIVRDLAKYSDSSSRTTSGSRDSDSGVNPTRSQNSTEHTRRSATGFVSGSGGAVAGDAGAVDGAAPAPVSAKPQARQNRLPAVTGLPQEGQPARAAPQSPQNLSPACRDAPQFRHVNTTAL